MRKKKTRKEKDCEIANYLEFNYSNANPAIANLSMKE